MYETSSNISSSGTGSYAEDEGNPVIATPSAGNLRTGQIVTLTLDLSKVVTVSGGIPTLTLNNGGIAYYVDGPATNSLIFSYTIVAGQNTSDLTVTGSALNGATINDAAGNAVDLPDVIVNPPDVLQIDTTASIIGTSLDGIALAATSMVVNGMFGTISGGVTGIVEAATGKVVNAGSVAGDQGDGTDMAALGTVINAASGKIAGALAGIVGAASGTVTNAGSIVGLAGNGIDLAAGAIITNLAGGVISGGFDGIVTAAGAVVINAGTISGGTSSGSSGDAIRFTGAGSRLVITPTAVFNGNVVALGAGAILELAAGANPGTISNFRSAFQGFQEIIVDAGANWTITDGDPAQALTVAAGATLDYDGTVYGTLSNAASGTITLAAGSSFVNANIVGAATGIVIGASASVLNTGTINGSLLDGVDAGAGSSITNDVTGYISGGSAGIVGGANNTVTNANSIIGTAGNGVELGAGSTVTNYQVISGGDSGVTGGAGVMVANSGSIVGTGQNGVELGAIGTVVNDLAGSITGGANGLIEAAIGKVINAGTITGVLADGILLGATGTVINAVSGKISGGQAGIAGAASDTVTNAGSIVGLNGDGIDLVATAVVTNLLGGSITGWNSGLVAGTGAIVTNAGTIAGSTSFGVDLTQPGKVTNTGTISGGNDTAVNFEGGNSLLVVGSGAVFMGKVFAAGIGNTLELAAGTGNLGNFTANFQGFQKIIVDAGANWTISGGDPAPAITVAQGGRLVYDGVTYGTLMAPVPSTIALGVGDSFVNTTTVGADTGVIMGTNANVLNIGTINGALLDGVDAGANDSITNAITGAIGGDAAGIVAGDNNTVTNFNSITGTAGDGMDLLAGGTITNFETIAGGTSGITGGANTLVSNIGGEPTISINSSDLTQHTIMAFMGHSTISLSGANNVVEGGAGDTKISGGSYNTYNVTAIGELGGLDIADFSSQAGDVLNLHNILGSGRTISSAISESGSGNDLLISVNTAGGSSALVANLRGMAGTTYDSLVANHSISI